ncbi:MAG: sulfatase-like hydrolase/transferase [Flavobacteriales bacterium]|nr:sulfatase-like hydrolase/transferase [Flavobacteriales bacterium]
MLILADDLGKEQLAMYPGVAGMKARTPVLDSLAREGLVFDRTWSMPVCSPTRASLLTGRYPFRHGVTNIVPPKRTHGGLPTSEHTVFQELKARADGPFATAVMGKWHLGDAANGDMNSPARFGVERYIGIAGGSIEDPYSWNRHINGVKGLCSVYITTEITDQALAWTRGRETPWMLWLTEYAPHSPFVEPPPHLLDEHRLRSLCDDPSELLLGVAAIEAMDRELGRFFGGLSPEVRDRTLVLFLSDNGTSWEMVNDLEGKGRCKRTLYRPGIEVPMIVCGPQVRKGRTDLPVSVTDVYATLVEAMGGVLPKYQDSHSFWPVLLSRNGRNGRDQLFSERGPISVPGGQVGWAMQVGRYKYMSLASGESHLFDLRRDPLEQSDLLNGQVTEKERALVDDFERRYAQLKAETL